MPDEFHKKSTSRWNRPSRASVISTSRSGNSARRLTRKTPISPARRLPRSVGCGPWAVTELGGAGALPVCSHPASSATAPDGRQRVVGLARGDVEESMDRDRRDALDRQHVVVGAGAARQCAVNHRSRDAVNGGAHDRSGPAQAEERRRQVGVRHERARGERVHRHAEPLGERALETRRGWSPLLTACSASVDVLERVAPLGRVGHTAVH